jgi:hypothetical protein
MQTDAISGPLEGEPAPVLSRTVEVHAYGRDQKSMRVATPNVRGCFVRKPMRARVAFAIEGEQRPLVGDVVDVGRHVPSISPHTHAQIDDVVCGQLRIVRERACRQRRANRIGAERQQVQRAELIVADLRKPRPRVLIRAGDIRQRSRLDLLTEREKLPSFAVVALRESLESLVVRFVAVTVTPGRPRPVASRTTPVMRLSDCG